LASVLAACAVGVEPTDKMKGCVQRMAPANAEISFKAISAALLAVRTSSDRKEEAWDKDVEAYEFPA